MVTVTLEHLIMSEVVTPVEAARIRSTLPCPDCGVPHPGAGGEPLAEEQMAELALRIKDAYPGRDVEIDIS